MKLIFLLSGENVQLAKWEVIRLAEAYGTLKNFEHSGRLLIVSWVGDNFYHRLALSHEVAHLIAECRLTELEDVFQSVKIFPAKLCVRVKSFIRINRTEIERKLGEILWRRGATISVSEPRVIYRIYINSEENCYVGVLKYVVNKKQFYLRRPNVRPYSAPFTIVPKFARALINLGCARRNMLDPMCGTGSFLIEAELMNISSTGIDFFKKTISGCAKNLRFFGLPSNLIVGDARTLPFKDETFECIVTDYPYYRSTKSPSDLVELYEKTSEEFYRVLTKSAVLVTNIDVEDYFKNFKLVAKFKQRVHGSLTRRIYLFDKN